MPRISDEKCLEGTALPAGMRIPTSASASSTTRRALALFAMVLLLGGCKRPPSPPPPHASQDAAQALQNANAGVANATSGAAEPPRQPDSSKEGEPRGSTRPP